MLVVKHEVQFAREAADRVISMKGGEFLVNGTPDNSVRQPSSV